MSDLLNKYIKAHDRFLAALVRYYKFHEGYLDRQSYANSKNLRRVLKEMRLATKEMEDTAQDRMHEFRDEWGQTHRLKKETKE